MKIAYEPLAPLGRELKRGAIYRDSHERNNDVFFIVGAGLDPARPGGQVFNLTLRQSEIWLFSRELPMLICTGHQEV